MSATACLPFVSSALCVMENELQATSSPLFVNLTLTFTVYTDKVQFISVVLWLYPDICFLLLFHLLLFKRSHVKVIAGENGAVLELATS